MHNRNRAQLARVDGAHVGRHPDRRTPFPVTGIAAAIAIAVLSLPDCAGADAYLDGIAAEAKRIDTIGRAKQELEQTRARAEQSATKATPRSVSRPAPGSATPDSLERELEEYPAVLSLYKLLDPTAKRKVLEEYVRAGDKDTLDRKVVLIHHVILASSTKK